MRIGRVRGDCKQVDGAQAPVLPRHRARASTACSSTPSAATRRSRDGRDRVHRHGLPHRGHRPGVVAASARPADPQRERAAARAAAHRQLDRGRRRAGGTTRRRSSPPPRSRDRRRSPGSRPGPRTRSRAERQLQRRRRRRARSRMWKLRGAWRVPEPPVEGARARARSRDAARRAGAPPASWRSGASARCSTRAPAGSACARSRPRSPRPGRPSSARPGCRGTAAAAHPVQTRTALAQCFAPQSSASHGLFERQLRDVVAVLVRERVLDRDAVDGLAGHVHALLVDRVAGDHARDRRRSRSTISAGVPT